MSINISHSFIKSEISEALFCYIGRIFSGINFFLIVITFQRPTFCFIQILLNVWSFSTKNLISMKNYVEKSSLDGTYVQLGCRRRSQARKVCFYSSKLCRGVWTTFILYLSISISRYLQNYFSRNKSKLVIIYLSKKENYFLKLIEIKVEDKKICNTKKR